MGEKMVDFSVLDYDNHTDYLNSFAIKKDFQYLGNPKVVTCLAKLGYRSTKIPYDEPEFLRRHDLAMQAIRPKITGIQPFSTFKSPTNRDPVLLEFKRREEPIYKKNLATIVFTMYTSTYCSEISGYLDLGMSWTNAARSAHAHTNWPGIFQGTAFLRPMPHHLSYSNPRYNMLNYSNSDNFIVLHDHRYGMMFMHRGDQKLIPVGDHPNPFAKNVRRSMAISPKYGTMIFYDHIVRKKV
ncbi:cilia- and flagella-associated protein 299 [Drosophila montana]|uniref:cilia- and flagella-associated protein 299 n=1 Tax=Drosophila montana TaxID=40370 RepID=UPI00313CBDA5